MIERRDFLRAVGGAAIAPALLGASSADSPAESVERALVLSGGGARGAYEGGLIGALAAVRGLSDGSPLLPYGFVCGTSIGALNSWFVATGQYTKLRDLWYTIGGQHLMQLKPQYAALHDPESGVLDIAASAVRVVGLTRNQRAVLESEPVLDWITRNVDPNTPLVMPMAWAVTNLSFERPEYFYLGAKGEGDILPEWVVHALQVTLGPQTIVREATPDLLHRALFASAAIPIVFDPVVMPGPDGTPCQYCDGGVASNSPVGIAHAVSKAADVVLLDPPFEPDADLNDAIEVAFSAYGTMQRKILETEMRNVYAQSVAKDTFGRLSPEKLARVSQSSGMLAKMVAALPVTELRYLRPEKVLPVTVAGFDDQTGINETFKTGWEDLGRGFAAYDWSTFSL